MMGGGGGRGGRGGGIEIKGRTCFSVGLEKRFTSICDCDDLNVI